MRDTLAPLVGGPFTIRYGGARKDATGQGVLAGLTQVPDTVNVYAASPHPEHTLIHEAGHVWDARGVAPTVMGGLLSAMEQFKPANKQEAYFGSQPEEYIAESFARALELMRQSRGAPTSEQLAAAERNLPGITGVVRWMMTQPPFGGLLSNDR